MTDANRQAGLAGVKMENFFAAFPDWRWDMTTLIASGDRVVCEFTKKVRLPSLIQ